MIGIHIKVSRLKLNWERYEFIQMVNYSTPIYLTGCTINPASKDIIPSHMSNYQLVECSGDTGLSTIWTHTKMEQCSQEIEHRLSIGRTTDQEWSMYQMGMDEQVVASQMAILNAEPKQVYVHTY